MKFRGLGFDLVSAQKMWPSSWVKPRTRMMRAARPRVHSGCRTRIAAMRRAGRGKEFKTLVKKICTWQGQFIVSAR